MSAKIKIVHVVEDLSVGGLERVIEQIVKGLDSAEFDQGVVCLNQGGKIADNIVCSGFSVQVLGLKSFWNLANLLKLKKIFLSLGVDVVHSHSYFANVFVCLVKLIGFKGKVVVHNHTTANAFSWRHRFINISLNFLADRIIFISEAVKKSYGIFADKSSVIIYNGVDLSKFNVNSAHKFSKRLVCVAGLNPHKGHEVLFNAFKMIQKEIKDVSLCIVGEGQSKEKLELLASSLDIKNVEFLGVREDIHQILKRSDLFVYAPIVEGLGMAVIEAMACGKPIVATRVGGLPEVVTEEVGILVDVGDVQSLAEAVRSLLLDPERIRVMGDLGHRRVRDLFSEKIMLQSIAQLYKELGNR